MRKNLSIGLGVSTVLALALGAAVPANADIQPNSTDVVGMGSDTVQYVADFLNDGYNGGAFPLPGFNTTAKVNRIFSFDATADAGGRAQYSATGRDATGPFPSAVVLRQGGFPLYRAQGSGDGYKDLINDTTAHGAGPYTIDFVRASRLPKASEQLAMAKAIYGASTTNTTGMHVFQIATDGLDIAVNNKTANVTAGDPLTCVPAAGVTVADLVKVYDGTYQTWGDLYTGGAYTSPGGTCATEPIAPVTPDAAKSGTGSDFFGDLKTASGNSGYALSARVIKVEEHDPAAFGVSGTIATGAGTANYAPQDIIGPFSVGRYNLIQTGYFDHVQDIHGGAPQSFVGDIALQTPGAGSVAAGAYSKARTLYIAVRDSAITSTTPFLPGGAKNWVQTFFLGTLSQYGKAASASLYTAAGVTQAYNDLGDVSNG
jgi:hypothetical protein